MKPPQCPVCSDNTTRHPGQAERCPTCRIVIVRNPRGEAERARDTHGRTVYLRRPNSAPDDTTRAARIHQAKSTRLPEWDPTEIPADTGNNPFGTFHFGKRKEGEPA